MTDIPSGDWSITLDKRDLVAAIGMARARATLRRVAGAPGGFESLVTFAACDGGLSVRSSNSAMDIPASGIWSSPIAVDGATLRRLAPKLAGPKIELCYADGRLALNGTQLSAREV